jgi:hypothetical protein
MALEEKRDDVVTKRSQIDALYWGIVLVWAGLVFIAGNQEFLPQVGSADAWSWIFAGAGLIALVGSLWRAYSPDWPSPTVWDYVWAAVLLIVGLAGFLSIQIPWPLILLLIGAALIGTTVYRRQ